MSRRVTLRELKVPCENPNPDRRRKNDWVCWVKFPRGLYALEEFGDEMCGTTFVRRNLYRVDDAGDKLHFNLNENGDKEAFAALSAKLEKVEIDLRNLRHTIATNTEMSSRGMHDVMAWLLRNGIVSPEQLTLAIERVLQQWDKEEQQNEQQ